MGSLRLHVQFEALFEHYQGKECHVQLEEITEILFCTRRNARIVLNKMEESGWIEWHPAPGRGKLSRLIFKRSRADVMDHLTRRYLDEGKISQALRMLDNSPEKLAQVVQRYLGVQHQEGQQVVRLPYYRPLSMLNPTQPMRRSEQHIARQLFSGLTRLDDNEQLQPDLAHHWEAIHAQHWRFYLRPGVRFHDERPLTTAIVCHNIEQLRTTRLFRHIQQVSSPSKWVVDIQLSQPDYAFPRLLAEVRAKIVLPESERTGDVDRFPLGTGPYKVVQNDDKRLTLQAFDHYFGFRPLLDQVEVWVIDDVYSSMIFPSLTSSLKPEGRFGRENTQLSQKGERHEEVELDPGCTYLLLNRKSGLAADERWAHYFSQRLNALHLFQQMPPEQIVELGVLPAYGLKPGWYHQAPPHSQVTPPDSCEVAIAYYERHPMFPLVAKRIEQSLKQDGLEVRLVPYSYAQPLVASDGIDLWIQPMGLANYRDDALAGWLLDYSEIEAVSQPEDFQAWSTLVDEWRAQQHAPFPARVLAQSLVEKKQIIPMFHCWLGVNKDHCGSLQNAQCNALGWFDFSQVWVKPEIPLCE